MKHLSKFDIFEGSAFKNTNKLHPKKDWDPNKKVDFRLKIENHVKSQNSKTKRIGNDLEIICDNSVIAQVMFRDLYIGIKESGNKFTDEFKYTELGKIKSKITDILKSCR